MRRTKKIFFLALLFFSILNKLYYSPAPNTPIFKKETISSWIPGIEKYFMYDRDNKRYKVSKLTIFHVR